MDEAQNMAEQQVSHDTVQSRVHPEHMSYFQTRIMQIQQAVDHYRSKPRSEWRLDVIEMIEVDLPRLQAAMEAALQGDVSGIAAEVQQEYQENAASIEHDRRFIARHPMGTLWGD